MCFGVGAQRAAPYRTTILLNLLLDFFIDFIDNTIDLMQG